MQVLAWHDMTSHTRFNMDFQIVAREPSEYRMQLQGPSWISVIGSCSCGTTTRASGYLTDLILKGWAAQHWFSLPNTGQSQLMENVMSDVSCQIQILKMKSARCQRMIGMRQIQESLQQWLQRPSSHPIPSRTP